MSFLTGFTGLGTGIVPLVEKSLQIWQSLADAKAFGANMTSIVAQLSMEYYRFYVWVKVSGFATEAPRERVRDTPRRELSRTATSTLLDSITSVAELNLESQVKNAVTSIVHTLAEVEKVAEKYRGSDISPPGGSQPSRPTSNNSVGTVLPPELSLVLPELGISSRRYFSGALIQRRNTERTLQQTTSIRSRFSFSSTLWGISDKEILQKQVDQLIYWNDRLEKLLPRATRASIVEQAVPGQVLRDENEGILSTLSNPGEKENEAVRMHARLWKERLDFEKYGGKMKISWFREYKRPSNALKTIALPQAANVNLRLFMFKNKPNVQATTVAVEEYHFSFHTWSNDDVDLATSRLTRLIHLISDPSTPPSLRLLKPLAFVEGDKALRLIYELPKDVSETSPPVSLFSLLTGAHEVSSFRPPSLETRLRLALQIASAVYSFMLVRWLHEDLTPHNIVFFRSKSSGRVLIDSPYIIGFSIARADDEGERSLNKLSDSQNIYLHPLLRVDQPEKRPRYHRRFDIWSLAILLLEIGKWEPLAKIVRKDLPKDVFGATLRDRPRKELPFFMGERYSNIVANCLAIGDGEDRGGEEIGSIYWEVVLELAKCQIESN